MPDPGKTDVRPEATLVDWAAALAEHGRWIRAAVNVRLGERQAVDEVMQEVALAAVAQRAPLAEPRRLAAWLYRLAVRQALLYRRRRERSESVRRPTLDDATAALHRARWVARSRREGVVSHHAAGGRRPPRPVRDRGGPTDCTGSDSGNSGHGNLQGAEGLEKRLDAITAELADLRRALDGVKKMLDRKSDSAK